MASGVRRRYAQPEHFESIMKLIPFDLKLAVECHPIQTRDGRPAKFIAHVPECEVYPVLALAQGARQVDSFTIDGLYCISGAHVRDLFMVPVPHTGWLNIYSDARTIFWKSKEDADIAADSDRIACIQITYMEGEGL